MRFTPLPATSSEANVGVLKQEEVCRLDVRCELATSIDHKWKPTTSDNLQQMTPQLVQSVVV